MNVPFLSLEDASLEISGEQLGPAANVLARFHLLVSQRVGAKVVLASSGTMALWVAAQALNLAGHQIAVPAYTVRNVWNAFSALECQLMPVDVEPATGCLDPNHLDEILELYDIRGVCYVCHGGTRGALRTVVELCRKHEVPLIVDGAWAWGAEPEAPDHLHPVAMGDIGIVSFSPHKPVTCGQGGAIVSRNPGLLSRAQALIDPERGGLNLRMSGLAAGLGVNNVNSWLWRRGQRFKQHQLLRELEKLHLWSPKDCRPPAVNVALRPNLVRSGFVEQLQAWRVDARPQYQYVPNVHFRLPGAEWWRNSAVYLPFGDLDEAAFWQLRSRLQEALA